MKETLNFIGIITLTSLPILLILKIWIDHEAINKLLVTDLILIVSSILGYYIWYYQKP
jgi:drug/metabolite transporter (DMT)-like permease